MKSSEKVMERLRRECGLVIPEGSAVRRVRSGRHQKAMGAWSWFIVGPNGRELFIGSACTVGDCLKAKTLGAWQPDTGTTEVEPKN